MSVVHLADGDLHYQFEGPTSAPVLVLSNSLGTDLHMWDVQMPVWREHFRVLRFDTRGHGESLAPLGPYSIEQMGHDVLALLDHLAIAQAHFCGLSMGGLIGQWLAINAADRLRKLVLCNTAAKIGNDEVWNSRIQLVEQGGAQAMHDLRDASIARWFTPAFAETHAEQAELITEMLAATPSLGYSACCAAVRDADYRAQLDEIKAPTLIVAGTADVVTTPEHARFLQAGIEGAEYAEFPAAHLSNVEAGDAFTQAVLTFLKA